MPYASFLSSHSLHIIVKAVSHSVLNPKLVLRTLRVVSIERRKEKMKKSQAKPRLEYRDSTHRPNPESTRQMLGSPERARTPASHVYTDVLNVSIMRLTVPIIYSTLSSPNTLRAVHAAGICRASIRRPAPRRRLVRSDRRVFGLPVREGGSL
jgi:hypothetical protein